MKKYVVTTPDELRSLCIRKDWFSCGSTEQYNKLFYANENGGTLEEIATIIWVCSDDVSPREVLEELKTVQEYYIGVLQKNRLQRARGPLMKFTVDIMIEKEV